MNNPQSEDKFIVTQVGDEKPTVTMYDPKESPVSQSVEIEERADGVYANGIKISPSWEKEFDNLFVKRTQSSTIGSSRDEMIAEYDILNVRKPDKIKSFISTTLSTLVKKMEGLKNQGECYLHSFNGTIADCQRCQECQQNFGFNAGISAAVEVVKKMGV